MTKINDLVVDLPTIASVAQTYEVDKIGDKQVEHALELVVPIDNSPPQPPSNS